MTGPSERPVGRLAPTASNRRKRYTKDESSDSKSYSKEQEEEVQNGSSDLESDSKEDEEGVQSGSSNSKSDSNKEEERAQNIDALGGTFENTNLTADEHEDTHMDDIDGEQGRGKGKSEKQKMKRKRRGKQPHMELGPIPGGPKDETLLKSFREHIAYAIWKMDKVSKVLRLHYHRHNQKKWKLDKEIAEVKDKVAKSGLLQLVEGCFKVVDKVLISAMVERWHRETNTFHLPFGEMTITLDDVSQILGIPVVGTPIHVDDKSFTVEEAADLLVSDLGVTKEDALNQLEGTFNVRMTWIRERCAGLVHNNGDAIEDKQRKVEYAVRGYLMNAFGCTVFPDTTGTKVSVKFLRHLKDVDKIHTYSWGSAVLAYLYNQLGVASKAESKSVGGCLTLLQVWIHEHLRFGNYIMNPKYDESLPRMHKWEPRQCAGDKVSSLISMREQLDDIKESQVVWDPYKGYREWHPFPLIAWFKGWLVCDKVEEPIYPDRVQRQLGSKQDIPDLPIRASDDERPKVDYLLHWEDHVIPKESRGKEAMDDWDCSISYIDWYRKITHRIVQNPKERVCDKRESCNRSRTLSMQLEEIQFSIDICRKPPIPSEVLVSLGRSYFLAERMMRRNKRKADANTDDQEHDQSKSLEGEEDEGSGDKAGKDQRGPEITSQATTTRAPTTATSLRETRQTRKKPTQGGQTNKKPTQAIQTRKKPAQTSQTKKKPTRKQRGV